MPLRRVHELTLLWFGLPGPLLTETGSAKTVSAVDVRVDDVGSILNFRIGFSLFDCLHWLIS